MSTRGGPASRNALAGHARTSVQGLILDKVEKLLLGSAVRGAYETTIATPRSQRALCRRLWMGRPRRSFTHIVSPVKMAAIGSQRIGTDMWNYLTSVKRIMNIPPSMMLQPWMGSDFTNDDLVKKGSVVYDYTQKVIATVQGDAESIVQAEGVPKPDAAVVWGHVVNCMRSVNAMPLKQEISSKHGERVRECAFSDVRKVSRRVVLPTLWDMRPDAKLGNSTTAVLKDAMFDPRRTTTSSPSATCRSGE